MILRLHCPNCQGYLAQPGIGIAPDGRRSQLYSADITDIEALVGCPDCGYEGQLPEQAKLMLVGAERLPGMGES